MQRYVNKPKNKKQKKNTKNVTALVLQARLSHANAVIKFSYIFEQSAGVFKNYTWELNV